MTIHVESSISILLWYFMAFKHYTPFLENFVLHTLLSVITGYMHFRYVLNCFYMSVCTFVQNLLTLAEELIGQIVYVGWPYLMEAMVHSLSNGTVQYYEVRRERERGRGKGRKERKMDREGREREGERERERGREKEREKEREREYSQFLFCSFRVTMTVESATTSLASTLSRVS